MLRCDKTDAFHFFFNLVLNLPEKYWPYLCQRRAQPPTAGIYQDDFQDAIPPGTATHTASHWHSSWSTGWVIGPKAPGVTTPQCWWIVYRWKWCWLADWLTLDPTDARNEPKWNCCYCSNTCFNQTAVSSRREPVPLCFRWGEPFFLGTQIRVTKRSLSLQNCPSAEYKLHLQA